MVLLVDDDDCVRRLIARALGRQGWHVEDVGTADDAIARMHDREFDVLITDVCLPDSGTDLRVVEAFRARHPGRPIVIATGSNVDALPAAEPGVAIVAKPYRTDDLVAHINELRRLSAG